MFKDLLLGGSRFCYAPAGEDGGAGAGGESGGEGADTGASDADTGDNQGEGNQGDNGSAGNSMLDGLSDTDGHTFDFSTGEKPEGFPDDFWDADNNSVNAQALFDGMQKEKKRAEDLRAKMGKGEHKAPETADQYKFEASEKAAEFIEADDPLVAAAQEVAHKHGLSQEQYAGFMSEILDKMVDTAGEQQAAAQETDEQRFARIQEEIKSIGPNGPQVLRANEAWANELLAEGTFNEEMVSTFKQEGLVSANMVKMLNALRARMGGSDVPHDTFDDGLPPDGDIADMLAKAAEKGDESEVRRIENKYYPLRAKAGRPPTLQF